MKFAICESLFLYNSDITLQRLSLFSNSEINISVAPWSSFYTFKEILCTKQPLRNNPEVFCKKRSRVSVSESQSLCQSLFFNKAAGLARKFKKETLAQLLSCDFVKFLRTPQGDCFWPFADVFKIDVLKISKTPTKDSNTGVFL